MKALTLLWLILFKAGFGLLAIAIIIAVIAFAFVVWAATAQNDKKNDTKKIQKK